MPKLSGTVSSPDPVLALALDPASGTRFSTQVIPNLVTGGSLCLKFLGAHHTSLTLETDDGRSGRRARGKETV